MTKPTIRELLDMAKMGGAAHELAERVEAVLRLHSTGHPDATICRGCDHVWPCKTVRALDGGVGR